MTQSTSREQNPVELCLADDVLFDEHVSPPGHPERPERLAAARQGVDDAPLARAARRLDARDASLDEMARVHTEEYVTALSRIEGKSGHLDADTFFSPRSYAAARRATGAALALTDALLDGAADYGFGLMRPPGHHARAGQSMGFCMLNHVAVAARHALERGARRVVIVDWDVHHGNGTEEIFESRPEVLYISLHQSPQYPGTGAVTDVGFEDGKGFTVNVPLAAGADNAVYAAALERVVLPIIEEYAPDLTLVSAGYDAHARDPLGGMQLDGERLRLDDAAAGRERAARPESSHRFPARGRLRSDRTARIGAAHARRALGRHGARGLRATEPAPRRADRRRRTYPERVLAPGIAHPASRAEPCPAERAGAEHGGTTAPGRVAHSVSAGTVARATREIAGLFSL